MRRSSFLLLLYIVILQVLDAITTYASVSMGNVEMNPLVKVFAHDLVKLLLFKGVVGLVVYLLVTDKNTMKYRKVFLLMIYTVLMLQAIIINTINMVIR